MKKALLILSVTLLALWASASPKSDSVTTGMEEVVAVSECSKAYPNPASQYVNFDYVIPEVNENTKVIIYNILGKEVKEIVFPEQRGTLKANISDLVEGIYFYSFVINDKPEITQKLIIKH